MHVINICAPGHADPYDSYGQIACELARHLNRLGAYVNVLPRGDRQVASQDAEVASLTARPVMAGAGGLLLGYPTMHAKYGALTALGPRLALTMFESSRIPPTWVEPLNACDAVLVPSRFCADVFAVCGVTVPIHVVPLGVGDVFQPCKRNGDGPFTFLAFLDRGARKGWPAAIQSFVMAFGDDPGYQLILKGRSRAGRPVVDFANDNIKVIYQDMTPAELYRLYCECDVMLNPNAGEGFGLLPREFACSGGIALATNWGGTADDIEQWGWGLPYTLTQADWRGIQKFEGLDLGLWAQPHLDGIASVLRAVADNRETYRAEALARAHTARTLYTWDACARTIFDIWKGVADGHRNGTGQAQGRRWSRQAHAA